MRTFEFHAYEADENGLTADRPTTTTREFAEKAQAVNFGGRMAKRVKGPVDIAFADDRAWYDRYITTARPSRFHISGYAMERLT